jgi:teichuronic acid exporter
VRPSQSSGNKRSTGLHAVKWAFVDRFGSQLVQLINILVLARILLPRDFGLIGILYIFLSISSALVDSGMGGALIRKEYVTNKDTSTFFFFNIVVSLVCYLCIYFTAPYVARFYHEPSLILLLRLLAISIIINAMGLVQRVLLVKSLSIIKVTRASLIASVMATVIAIICALYGLGIYSLVAMLLCQCTLNTLLLCVYCRWRPTLEFSMESFHNFFSFGFSLLLTALLNIGFANIYQPLIAKNLSIVYAGFYYQAKRLYEVPILSISQVVDSVTYPILVRFQNDRDGLESRYKKIVLLLVFVSAPVVVLISILSKDIVLVFLGKNWLFSAQLLSILCFAGIFQILETTSGSLLKVEGRTKLIFRLELIKKVIIIINIIVFYRFGIIALMFVIVVNAAISFLINQYFTSIKMTNAVDLLKIVFNVVCMGGVALLIKQMITNTYISIVVTGSVSLIVYLFLGYLQRIPAQTFLISLIPKYKASQVSV